MKFKAEIVKVHRWFGLAMCVFFVTWFMSGFVMLYVDFPQFSAHDRLLNNSPLMINACKFEPASLSGQVQNDTAWKSIRIDMLLNRPVIRFESISGDLQSYYADNGHVLHHLSRTAAEAIAINYLHRRYRPALVESIAELDQWIPRSYYLIHMPIYRITMDDPALTMVYISSKNGEIIQVHNRSARILAWCGPIIHWIYPKELIIRRPLWKAVVIILSSLGILGSLSGIIIGFIRVKKKKKSYSSPYKKRWFKWHHYTGFIFGLFTFTWVFSGLLTMSPFGWSPEADLNERENKILQGGPLQLSTFNRPVDRAFSKADRDFIPVEIELKRFQGRSYYIGSDSKGKTRIAEADAEGRVLKHSFPFQIVSKAINQLNKPYAPLQQDLIHQEDNYYYSKHNHLKLPVLRIQYNDPDQTWYYADPSTGNVVLKNNHSRRVNRWLYHGLHSLDFFNLQHHRPYWDVLIIFLLIGGTGVSITGLVLAIKRIF